MRVLALDIASATGWAFGPPGVPACGLLKIVPDSGELGHAFFQFECGLHDLIEELQPEVLAYEAPLTQIRGKPAINSLVTSQRLLGLVAIAQLLGYTFSLRVMPAQIAAIRKHFTGDKWASKDEVWRRCRMVSWPVHTLDEADACAVWDYTHGRLQAEALGRRAARSR